MSILRDHRKDRRNSNQVRARNALHDTHIWKRKYNKCYFKVPHNNNRGKSTEGVIKYFIK